MDYQAADKITAEINKIRSLRNELKETLQGVDAKHSLYGALLIELELIEMNLDDIKKRL